MKEDARTLEQGIMSDFRLSSALTSSLILSLIDSAPVLTQGRFTCKFYLSVLGSTNSSCEVFRAFALLDLNKQSSLIHATRGTAWTNFMSPSALMSKMSAPLKAFGTKSARSCSSSHELCSRFGKIYPRSTQKSHCYRICPYK